MLNTLTLTLLTELTETLLTLLHAQLMQSEPTIPVGGAEQSKSHRPLPNYN